MKQADVIIGANFGDEGKGLVTDFCASAFGDDAIVVRFNGGAQAGHTVTTPDGRRHVFSHFGSGSLVGAETFLSRFFVCHPMLFRKEHAVLAPLAPPLRVHIDARAYVSTPYDMMINQLAEENRGRARHGSCGMGFGETIERCEKSPYTLTYNDLRAPDLKDRLRLIRDRWVPVRLAQLGINNIAPAWRERLAADYIVEGWSRDVEFFLSATQLAPADILSRRRHGIVFEGAQGLLLDQTRGQFPHVTRSHTGIRNVLDVAREAGLAALRVHYITRAYMTRHGAGPLAGELPAKPYTGIEDATNIHNDWQGSLRFALLDADILAATIGADLSDAHGCGLKIDTALAVTCLDQIEGVCRFYAAGREIHLDTEAAAEDLRTRTALQGLVISHGPTRAAVTRLG